MYLIVAADPAVSCKKNRSSLMSFLIIQGFPERQPLVHGNIFDCNEYLESSQRYVQNNKTICARNEVTVAS